MHILGTDSTKAEKEEVKRKSIDIYRTIKTLDKKLGDELLYSEDLKTMIDLEHYTITKEQIRKKIANLKEHKKIYQLKRNNVW